MVRALKSAVYPVADRVEEPGVVRDPHSVAPPLEDA
jgi:hypothetical protein